MDGNRAEVSPSAFLEGEGSLESLPKELGVLLIVAGLGGVLLPGPVGTPLLIVGGLILFPNLFRNVDRSVSKRFPKFHQKGLRQARRFVTDLERRYPTGV